MQFEHQTVELPKIKQKNNALPDGGRGYETPEGKLYPSITTVLSVRNKKGLHEWRERVGHDVANYICLLYTSPSPRDKRQSRMPSSA